jgi:hypothetical protein
MVSPCPRADPVTLADVLERYTQWYPDDAVLELWGPAVVAAAENVYVIAGKSVSNPVVVMCCIYSHNSTAS